MVKHGWVLLIVGGLLSLPFSVEAFTTSQPILIALSVVLAIGPLLILVGYDAIADRSGGGAARSGLQVAGLGLLILAGTEIASIVMPLTNDAKGAEQLDAVGTVGFALIALGSLAAGLVLFRRWLGIALPLLIGAAALGVVLAPLAVPDQPAFAVWALSCTGLGLALRFTR
jgi:hypothetical protein